MHEAAEARALLQRWILEGGPIGAPDPGAARLLIEAAREQGMAGLLYAELAGGDAGWPADSVAVLHDIQLAWLCRGVQQLDCARRVQALLHDRGWRSLPLKGAAVVERWYASPAERPMGDVDLLVLDDWRGAREALLQDGFRTLARADHAWALRDPESGAVLELHRGVTSCPALHPLDAEGLWSRSVTGTGQVGRLPAAEDVLVHLALHAAFQHGLVLSLVQYLDFRRVLAAGLDMDRVHDVAERMRALPSLGAALAAAARVVGLPGVGRHEGAEAGRPAPLDLLTPAVPRLAGVRWQLCRGRRARLVWHTVMAGEGAGLRRWGRLLHAAAQLLPWSRRPPHVDPRPAAEPPAASDEALAQAALRLCLDDFDQVRLRVTGQCMEPALAPGRTVILAGSRRRPPRWGDVVLVRQPEGLRLHRLVLRGPLARWVRGWRSQADRAAAWDAPVGPADVLATVVEIEGGAGGAPRDRGLAARSLLRALWTSLRSRVAVAGPG